MRDTTSDFAADWSGSSMMHECSLHQISPYIGKIKSSMAGSLISKFTKRGERILDPFAGSGTIALEGWRLGRGVIANDLSPYAYVLMKAKLFPILLLEDALAKVDHAETCIRTGSPIIDLRKVPRWVRSFFHNDTLRETISMANHFRSKRSHFLLSNLLGILHHQRPGFLSFPSSHTVPYLREKRFPRQQYPELYQYRSVKDRLEKKIRRTLKRVPELDPTLERTCYKRNAATLVLNQQVDAIVTSPPYMRQLDYGRDNRLRLWLIGESDWWSLDNNVSPSETHFLRLIKSCLLNWNCILKPQGRCVLVLGDAYSRYYRRTLPEVVCQIATREIGTYSLEWQYKEEIPNERRVRRDYCGSLTETILVLRNN